jgi:hypothetical protein
VATVTDLSDNALAELEAAVAAEKQARKERVEYVTLLRHQDYRWSKERGLEYFGALSGGWRQSHRAPAFETLRSELNRMVPVGVDKVVVTAFLARLAETGKL